MEQLLVIGIDGGATKVSAWQVVKTSQNNYALGELNAQQTYRDIPGYLPDFQPVNIQEQLAQYQKGEIQPTDEELQQGAVYVEACAKVVEQLCHTLESDSVLLGIGMPGIKTADKRGIAVVANGPRMLNYADDLEYRLKQAGIQLAAPIFQLGSDADYCGIGENYADQGAFRAIDWGYYLGGGTGVADALKLNGQLVPLDQTKSWLAKTWEMKNESGDSLELFASAGGIQKLYARLAGTEVDTLNQQGIYPLQIAQLAERGNTIAQETFQLVIENLSLLLYERITTLFAGWQHLFSFVNPSRADLASEHPYTGQLFQKIILGQRLGELLASEQGQKVLYAPLTQRLKERIQQSPLLDKRAKEHYRSLEPLISISRLREAPALGAGIDAFLHYKP